MTANRPRAGRSPQKLRFARPVIPRPCGEMTSGTGGLFAGPRSRGRAMWASRASLLWAWPLGSDHKQGSSAGRRTARTVGEMRKLLRNKRVYVTLELIGLAVLLGA